MPGFFTDTIRLAWGALYWNLRKSIYFLRGRRSACPCHAPSDSGRAYETGCDAVLSYASPARFRRICPLLARRADGSWVCSVNSEAVRPFWARACAFFAIGFSGVFLCAGLVTFGLLRLIGYEIAPSQVFWPPAWSEFRAVQSGFYYKKSQVANQAGRYAEALLLLSTAYELKPDDYAIGIQLAQLRQVTQPLLSDQIYARLLARHPAQRPETAQAWFRALLARGDFVGVQRVAGERLLHSGPTPPAAWVQAFLHATRQLGDPAALDSLLVQDELPPAIASLLHLERELYRLNAPARFQTLLTAASTEREAFACYHVLSRLLQEGEGAPSLVLAQLARTDSPLGNREKAALQLAALAVAEKSADRAALVNRLLAQPTRPAICELLSSHFAAHPEPALFGAYVDKLTRDPIPEGDARYPQLLALYAAAGAHRDAARMSLIAEWITAATGREFRTLAATQTAFMRFPSGARLENILPILQPMPLETTYALYARFAPPPPFSP